MDEVLKTPILMTCMVVVQSIMHAASNTPELPRVYINTAVESPGKSIIAADSVALKQAITNAVPGDNILLMAGGRYEGNFKLPPKAGTGWITITTMTGLPSENTRISQQYFPTLAKI